MTLHMLRLDPDPAAVARWGAAQRVTRTGADDGYMWHALLKAAFGDLAPKPFRLVESEQKRPYLLGYCEADKAALRDHAETFADPSALQALDLSSLAVKAMPSAFAAGQRLGFDVRVRPVIRTSRNDPYGKQGREVDAFLAIAKRSGDELDRAAVYRDWLVRAMGAGVQVVGARPVAIRRSVLLRRLKADSDGNRPLVTVGKQGGAPDVTIRGDLTVVDPEVFRALLARGVGRHRAFGFGMLLLTPPGRAIG